MNRQSRFQDVLSKIHIRMCKMKGKWTIVGSLLAVVLLGLAAGLTQAQGPTPSQTPLPQGEGGVGVQAALGTAPSAALGTGFTYQGQLKSGGNPVNGTCDFQFGLWDAAGSGSPPTGGNQIGSPQTKTGVSVSNGLFSIPDLDFGSSAFTGDARWLQIGVRCPAGSGSYATLSPRQALTAAPYALGLRPGAIISGTSYQVLKVMSNAPTGGIPAVVTGEMLTATDGVGVYGSHNNPAAGAGGAGVWGRTWSPLGSGVEGTGINGATGVKGTSTYGTGVYGVAGSPSGLSAYTTGSLGVWGDSNSGPGVVGTTSKGTGVYGESSGADLLGYWHAGVYGTADNGTGVEGNSSTGTGVRGTTDTGNFFVGCRWEGLISTCNNYYRVSYTGTVHANGGYVTGGADVAEFISTRGEPQPGDVVEIDPDHVGQFRLASTPNSTSVAGVISTNPGASLGAIDPAGTENTGPRLALAGRVPVKVSAENGAIRPGDLLVASSMPGHAMRAPANPAPGTVIGKSLGQLDDGAGVVEMLVMLR
jgi:hypothetical protein